MVKDKIIEIGIDEKEQIYIMPASKEFPYMYREAMEVHWDPKRKVLHSPKPREWTYLNWFNQITDAAREQGCELIITSSSKWKNISIDLKDEIIHESSQTRNS